MAAAGDDWFVDLDDDACYRAFRTRDARFDGRLFSGCRTTGVYCRPICPVRTPRREHMSFYPTAAAAQAAGFRPCLRCRPETAPDVAAWRGTSNTISRALSLIEAGALDDSGVDRLASQLGIGERHLRRLFREHLGASPNAVALTRRVLLAMQLIRDTQLSMADVALAAGFGSVRRFNEVFQQLFHRPPGALRRDRSVQALCPAETLIIQLPYCPPYDWPSVISFLKARATDLWLRRALARIEGRTFTAHELVNRAERWRPWRAYAAQHLWSAAANARNGDRSVS